jgi:dual-specificity kinase
VAIKISRAGKVYRNAAEREFHILEYLQKQGGKGRNRLVHIRDKFELSERIFIVMDLLDKSLYDFLKENDFAPFPDSHIQSFAHQILEGLACKYNIFKPSQ